MLPCSSYAVDMLPLTPLLLRQPQPLQHEASATTERSGVLDPQPCWDVPCSVGIFALCGKAEKPVKAQSPSSSEKMHVYTKQGLSWPPHCSSMTFPVKNENLSFPFLAHQPSMFKCASAPFQGNNSVLALPAGLVLSLPSVRLA